MKCKFSRTFACTCAISWHNVLSVVVQLFALATPTHATIWSSLTTSIASHPLCSSRVTPSDSTGPTRESPRTTTSWQWTFTTGSFSMPLWVTPTMRQPIRHTTSKFGRKPSRVELSSHYTNAFMSVLQEQFYRLFSFLGDAGWVFEEPWYSFFYLLKVHRTHAIFLFSITYFWDMLNWYPEVGTCTPK